MAAPIQELVHPVSQPIKSSENHSPQRMIHEHNGNLPAGQLLKMHKEVFAKIQSDHPELNLANPYWDYTANTEDNGNVPPLYEHYTRFLQNAQVPIEVRIGKIGSFTSEEMAIIAHLGSRAYLEKGTFVDVPDERVDEIYAFMMGDFNPDRLIISVRDNRSPDHYDILGGCMVNPGSGNLTLREAISNPDASLSTTYSLQFDPMSTNEAMGEEMIDVPENELVIYTRFFRNPFITLKDFTGDYLEDFFHAVNNETLAGMVRAVDHWRNESGRTIRFGILDTHINRIVKQLVENYHGVVLDNRAAASAHIQHPHPLAFHYVDMPGKLGKPISVIGFEMEEHLEYAGQYDDEYLGKKVSWDEMPPRERVVFGGGF